MKTYIPKQSEFVSQWHLFDAKGKVLGRLATRIAWLLMGKNKPAYTSHLQCGDHVVVVNAKEIQVTGNKRKDKIYSHYTGYPGGRREYNFEFLLAKKPEEIIRTAVRKMLPKNRMGDKMLKHLHIFAGSEHEHQAQNPQAVN